jgi:hypothetical protein
MVERWGLEANGTPAGFTPLAAAAARCVRAPAPPPPPPTRTLLRRLASHRAHNTQNKYYSCALTDPALARIVGPVLPLSCSTGASKAVTAGSALAGVRVCE